MAYSPKLLAVLLASFLASSTTTSARKLDSGSTLLTHVKLEREVPASCWDVLLELHSCSDEVVLFFLNGETHLGTNCCNAIRTIQQQCFFSSMLGSLGITTEESNILRGYCDAIAETEGGSSTPAPTSVELVYNSSLHA